MWTIIERFISDLLTAIFGPAKSTVSQTLGKTAQERDDVTARLNDVKAADTARDRVASEPVSVRDKQFDGFFRK